MISSFWRQWLNLLLGVFAGLSLVLVLVSNVLVFANRSMQADVNARAQYVNQTVQLERVSQAIIRAAATAALNNKDVRLGDLLTANGIRYEAAPDAAGTSAPAAPATAAAAGPPGRANTAAPAQALRPANPPAANAGAPAGTGAQPSRGR